MVDIGLSGESSDGKRISRAFYVYFVQAASMRLIKIGIARDIAHRLCGLQVGSPDRLNLLGVIRPDGVDPKTVEQHLHAEFHDLHSHGEWYRPGDRLLAYIERHAISLNQNQVELAQQAMAKLERKYPAPHLEGITAAEIEKIKPRPQRIIAAPRATADIFYPKGGPKAALVIGLIKEVGVERLSQFDGCSCGGFSVRNVDVDICCGKGRDRGVWVSSGSGDYTDADAHLRAIADEVASQVEAADGRGPMPRHARKWSPNAEAEAQAALAV